METSIVIDSEIYEPKLAELKQVLVQKLCLLLRLRRYLLHSPSMHLSKSSELC